MSLHLYDPFDPELVRLRSRARILTDRYNRTTDDQRGYRRPVLRELFGVTETDAWIEPPFFCDYGRNIELGERFYANTGCTILDCARVTIGDNVLVGPNVQLYAATHPLYAVRGCADRASSTRRRSRSATTSGSGAPRSSFPA